VKPDPKPVRVLIADDNVSHAEALADGLEMDGYRCRIVHSGSEAVALLSEATFEAVITDLVMPDVSGIDVLKEARRLQPDASVLLVTGHESLKTAVDALRHGAADYLTKPVDLVELRARLARAVESGRLRRDHIELRRQIDKRFGFEGILGSSPQMRRLFEVLGQVSGTSATVLITGESGTGKELVARAIHQNSPRADEHFVAVNCAALSEGLIESELFGHVKGSFTGAVASKEGRIVYADGGTLFLDEVGDMPLATQAKLLRVLETREVQPVGGNHLQKVDIRLIAATNRDLRTMVRDRTSARTSCTASRSSRSSCRRCGIAKATSPCSSTTSSPSSPRSTAAPSAASRPRRARRSCATTGRGTSASCGTRSRAWCCSRAAGSWCSRTSRTPSAPRTPEVPRAAGPSTSPAARWPRSSAS
jgi:two-component system response regulator HydG